MFFILLFLALICEILHRRLSEVILHNHRVTTHNRKIEESKANKIALSDKSRQQKA
jgi:ATP/ADP translocase